jgi:hypothetical protein
VNGTRSDPRARERDAEIRQTVYRRFASSGRRPGLGEVAADSCASAAEVRAAFRRLSEQRLLVLEPDGETIRMAPPFSGVPTQHRVSSGGIDYFANCAWDALGIPAALHREGVVESRCEQTLEPLRLEVGVNGPEPSDWLFHCLVPAARWWQDIVFT